MLHFRECFYDFVLICCYKLNPPHYVMGNRPRQAWLVSLGTFPFFRSHDFHHGCLYVESSEGRRGGLK